MNEDAYNAALTVLEILHDIRVPAFVGGSLASTVFGTPRSTIDADLVARLRPVHVKPFIEKLGTDFYSDEQAILSAVNTIAGNPSFESILLYRLDYTIYK